MTRTVVFVVKEDKDYESEDIVGLFTQLDEAKKAMDARILKDAEHFKGERKPQPEDYDWYTIEEWTLDSPSEYRKSYDFVRTGADENGVQIREWCIRDTSIYRK